MSLIFATQVTAVATLALAILALAAAGLAGLAFWRQSQEVGLLLGQSKRDIAERRRAQASRVFSAAVGDPPRPPRLINPYAHNASDLPIYDTQIWYAEPGGGISGPENVGMIMPGGEATAGEVFVFGDALQTITLTFRDAAGVLWVRLPGGHLTEQARPTPRDSIAAALEAVSSGPLAPPAGKANQATSRLRIALPRKPTHPDPDNGQKRHL
jgi:hypothetical protein